jgi:hypothetical protein
MSGKGVLFPGVFCFFITCKIADLFFLPAVRLFSFNPSMTGKNQGGEWKMSFITSAPNILLAN